GHGCGGAWCCAAALVLLLASPVDLRQAAAHETDGDRQRAQPAGLARPEQFGFLGLGKLERGRGPRREGGGGKLDWLEHGITGGRGDLEVRPWAAPVREGRSSPRASRSFVHDEAMKFM